MAQQGAASAGIPDNQDGECTTFVVLPALGPNQFAVVFDDGSYCLEWVPSILEMD